jgi:hypothetical protein
MKRDFNLPENDRDYLNNLGLEYEVVKSDNYRFGYSNLFVVIYGYFINQDYYQLEGGGNKVDVLLQIPSGYPNVQIDMASFHPHLKRVDKQNIPNIHLFYDINSKKWQTWSRHRSGAAVWDPTIDYIGTHMEYVEAFLKREVGITDISVSKSGKIKSTVITKEKNGIFILQTTREEKPIYKKLEESAYKGKLNINVGSRK